MQKAVEFIVCLENREWFIFYEIIKGEDDEEIIKKAFKRFLENKINGDNVHTYKDKIIEYVGLKSIKDAKDICSCCKKRNDKSFRCTGVKGKCSSCASTKGCFYPESESCGAY